MKPFQVLVFGKTGCDKCEVLNQRLDKLLAKKAWSDFEKVPYDGESLDGLVTFCQAECLNPQRIPAMLVMRKGVGATYAPMPNPAPGKADPVCGKSRLYQYMGLQTDYTAAGKGLLTPKMIESVLQQALEQAS